MTTLSYDLNTIAEIHGTLLALVGVFVVLRLSWFREDYRTIYNLLLGKSMSIHYQEKCNDQIASDNYSEIVKILEFFVETKPDKPTKEALRCLKLDLEKIKSTLDWYKPAAIFSIFVIIVSVFTPSTALNFPYTGQLIPLLSVLGLLPYVIVLIRSLRLK